MDYCTVLLETTSRESEIDKIEMRKTLNFDTKTKETSANLTGNVEVGMFFWNVLHSIFRYKFPAGQGISLEEAAPLSKETLTCELSTFSSPGSYRGMSVSVYKGSSGQCTAAPITWPYEVYNHCRIKLLSMGGGKCDITGQYSETLYYQLYFLPAW